MSWLLALLPRRWLQRALQHQWEFTLTRSEYVCLHYWGATGNREHHEFAWADKLPKKGGAA